jgi:hypothetical protein
MDESDCSAAELVQSVLRASGDQREVIADAHARYFGAELTDDSLVAGPGARPGSKRFEDWLKEGVRPLSEIRSVPTR